MLLSQLFGRCSFLDSPNFKFTGAISVENYYENDVKDEDSEQKKPRFHAIEAYNTVNWLSGDERIGDQKERVQAGCWHSYCPVPQLCKQSIEIPVYEEWDDWEGVHHVIYGEFVIFLPVQNAPKQNANGHLNGQR